MQELTMNITMIPNTHNKHFFKFSTQTLDFSTLLATPFVLKEVHFSNSYYIM